MIDTYTPTRFEHRPDNVPDELKTDETWVCCDENKVPLIATLSGAVYAASSTDPATWRSHEEAYEAWLENEWSYAGVGRVIRAEEGLVGVDFDKCLNPETGELTPWATAIIERLDSYAEVSPSSTGVKVWVKAPTITRAYVKPGLEIYPRGRYFTVTGLVLGETREIARRDEELEAIVAEEFPRVDRDRTAYDGPKRALDLLDYLEKANVEIFSERSDETGRGSTAYGARGSKSTPAATSPAPASASTPTARRSSAASTRIAARFASGVSSKPSATPSSTSDAAAARKGG